MEHTYDEYTYRPLDNDWDWIRLLLLVSPRPRFENKLLGCLVYFPRDETPDYYTLSYTWGNQEPTSEILLHEESRPEMLVDSPSFSGEWEAADLRRMQIRPNLESALRELRPKKEECAMWIWIDALCINQQDDKEKAYQVRNMDKVYRGHDVLIWLGESSENSDLAIELLEEIYSQGVHLADEDLEIDGKDPTRQLFNIYAHGELVGVERRHHWHAIWDLLGRPWFNRRWIVQETVLSSKDKQCYVGNRSFPWQLLALAAAILEQFPALRPPQVAGEERPDHSRERPVIRKIDYKPPPPLDRVSTVMCLNSTASARPEDLTLGRLLESFVGFESKDPRDGIYAFVSMASDIVEGSWLPDYSEKNTVASVYRKAAYQLMSTGGGRIDFICRTHPEMSKALLSTSWVPVFGPQQISLGSGNEVLEERILCGYNTNTLVTFNLPSWHWTQDVYSACGPHRFAHHLSGVSRDMMTTPKYLKLHGVHVATIKRLGEMPVLVQSDTGMRGFNIPSDWFDMLGVKNQDLESLPDEFFRSVTGNRIISEERFLEQRVQTPPDGWVETVRNTLRGRTVEEAMDELAEATPISKEMEMVASSTKVMLSNFRRFALMDTSMGFVPVYSEPEDMIFILGGCSVPVVVRRRQADTIDGSLVCELVGECYLHGFMEGECFKTAGGMAPTWQKVSIY